MAPSRCQNIFIFMPSGQELHVARVGSLFPPAQCSPHTPPPPPPDAEELKEVGGAGGVQEQLEIITHNQRPYRKAAERQGEVFCLAGL